MTQSEHLYREIHNMVEHGDIETTEAVRLLLLSHAQLLSEMTELKRELAELRRYPSLTWLWANRRRDVVVLLTVVFLIYTFLFAPWQISDLRQAILHLVGLPTDLGIGIPPTPIP